MTDHLQNHRMSNKRLNLRAIMTIASKDFADRLYEKSTSALIIVFMMAVWACSLNGSPVVYIQRLAVFFPLIGIVLGYDALTSEIRGKSMNVLLTHPVFRDSVILGKFLAVCMSLFCVVLISLLAVAASDFIFAGIAVDVTALTRFFLFGVFTFFYLLIFASFGILTSVLFKSDISSLTAGIVVWINLCFVLGPTVLMLAAVLTGTSMFDGTDEFVAAATRLYAAAPIHHFARVTGGDST